MDQTLKGIRGGGGSIKVGAVGTISSLMTRELQSSSSSSSLVPESDEQASSSCVKASMKHQITSSTTPRRQKPKVGLGSEYKGNHNNNNNSNSLSNKQQQTLRGSTLARSLNDPYVGGLSNKMNCKIVDFASKTRSHKRNQMVSSENARLEKTPLREKPMRKGSNVVEIVDINCGNSAGSLSSRLKKLGISRMSQSFM